MANDGSIASQTEQWIVDQLNAVAELTGRVELFAGTAGNKGEEVVAEILRKLSPHVFVFFEGDQPIETEEGKQDYDAIYSVYACVQNRRGAGGARVGEGTTTETLGLNKLRDLIRTALHDQGPAKSGGGFYTDRTEFRGVQIVFQERGAFICRAELAVHESPTS